MNKLQLVQCLRREAGVAGGNTAVETPTTTINQTGEYGQLVNRIDEAWTQIQQQFNWDFLWEQPSLTIMAGTNTTASAQVIPTRRYVKTSARTVDGGRLAYVPWADFSDAWPAALITDGVPTAWTIRPDKAFIVNHKPSADFVIALERYKNPVPMIMDVDEPAIDTEHHMLIVWKACMLHFKHEVAGAEYRAAKDSYDEKMMALNMVETPEWGFGSPLL